MIYNSLYSSVYLSIGLNMVRCIVNDVFILKILNIKYLLISCTNLKRYLKWNGWILSFFCATDEYYLLVIQCPCEGDVTSGQIESINTTINHFH